MMWLSVLLLLAVLLTGCEADSVEIGMVETHLASEWRATYTTFSGTKTDIIQADAGQTLVLEYDAQVDKGMLDIQIENPDDEVIWEMPLQEDNADTVQVPLPQEGRYALRIRGEDTGGGWDLTWDIQ
jgi:hypothetical protein